MSLFRRYELLVLASASVIFIPCIFSPPHLMDDVDSVQASIARTMLQTGDWVTPRLDGVSYLEKPPLKWWLIAIFFKILGVHDYAARLPLVLITVLLCWLTFRIGAWAFDVRAGFYAGLVLSTCLGLFLFTRVLIVDAQLTFTITLALWAFLRALDKEEPYPRHWSFVFWAATAFGVLFKGLIGALFPFAAACIYLLLTKQKLTREIGRRLQPLLGIFLFFAIAAPWHVLAMLRNPPYFYFGLQSGPAQYHGFLWFYFINEHLLRFLNMRYPHDYNKVPLLLFWLLHLAWLFPWSVYFPALFRLNYRNSARTSQTRLMALCSIGFVMVFFSFSSRQEYYSLPIYPAVALLLGCAIASANPEIAKSMRRGDFGLRIIFGLSAAVLLFLLLRTWRAATPGDISQALIQKQPSSYTLSLGHFGDLTLESFAYLRLPLSLALAGVFLGFVGLMIWTCRYRFLAIAATMVIFFHAARFAMIVFDPYLSSYVLAKALRSSPPGRLIVDDQYYVFSSVFFYADTTALLHNGRVNNLEYGSNAPGAPPVFIGDSDLARRWASSQRFYLMLDRLNLDHIAQVIGRSNLRTVKESGGKLLLSNMPVY